MFILPKFVGESWMRKGIVGRSTTRTCIFPQPKSRKRQHTECQTSSQEYDQFFLRSTNRISHLCLTLNHIICRNQWTVFRGCWKGIQLEWCYQSLAQFVEKVLLLAALFSLKEMKTKCLARIFTWIFRIWWNHFLFDRMRLRCGASCTSGSSACVEDGCGGTYGMPSVISPPVTGMTTYLLNKNAFQ